jgi:hypothetical protein
MTKETGGPAFPFDSDVANVGMTLRDYFAAKAMQAYINSFSGDTPDHRDAPLWVPYVAYQMADSMLLARNQ